MKASCQVFKFTCYYSHLVFYCSSLISALVFLSSLLHTKGDGETWLISYCYLIFFSILLFIIFTSKNSVFLLVKKELLKTTTELLILDMHSFTIDLPRQNFMSHAYECNELLDRMEHHGRGEDDKDKIILW